MPNSDGKMVVWVGVASCDAVRLEEDGRILPAVSQFVQDGCQFKVVADSLKVNTVLSVVTQQNSRKWWSLKMDRTQPNFLEWTRRVKDRRDPDLAEVNAELLRKERQASHIETTIDYENARAWIHRRLGQIDLAIQSYREVSELARIAGYPSIAFEAQYRLANTLRQFGFIAEAKEALQIAKTLVIAGHGKDKIDLAYHTANILQDEARLAEAADWFQSALIDAERVDYREKMRIATLCLAELYVDLDWLQNAQKLLSTFDRLVDGATECEKVPLLALQGWASLQLAQADDAHGVRNQQNIKNIFYDALKAEEQCKNYQSRSNIYANLAETAFLENNFTEARDWMEKAFKIPGLIVPDELQLLNLDTRLSMQAGRPDAALRSLKKLDDISRKRPDLKRSFYECTIALGTVEALRASGQPTAEASNKVRSCLDNKTGSLGPSDIRNLRSRAKSAGISF